MLMYFGNTGKKVLENRLKHTPIMKKKIQEGVFRKKKIISAE